MCIWSLIQASILSLAAIPLLLLLSWHRDGGRLLLCLSSNELGVQFKPCFVASASGTRGKKQQQESQFGNVEPDIRQVLGANTHI